MSAALAMLAGVLLGLGSASDGPGSAWLCTSLVLLLLWAGSAALRRGAGRARPAAWLPLAALMLAGLSLATHHAQQWRERRPAAPHDTRVLLEATLITVPVRDGATLRIDVEDAQQRRWRLDWRDARAAPRVGERWRLLVRPRPLEDTVNFTGFDTARQAFRDGVHARGRVIESALNVPLRLAPASLQGVRARIAARIRDAVADPDAAGLITALAVGLTDGISADQWRVFNATGITHLVAISGLHVTLFSWLAYRLARAGWRWLPGRRFVDRDPFALLFGLAAAGGYALLAGGSVPTQRTWIMLALYVLARLAARGVGAGRLWGLALMAVLLVDPAAPLAAGFWLSFAAVGALLLFMEGTPVPGPVSLWGLVRAQWVVMLALAPLGLMVFGGGSAVGLLVNLVAIPLVSFVFVPLVLAGALLSWLAPQGGAPLLELAAAAHHLCWPVLSACADLEFASWRASPAGFWLLATVPAVFVGLCAWPRRLRLTALCLLPVLLLPAATSPPAGASIHVLDAGRGTAVLVRTRQHVLLFDTGDSWGTRGSRATEIVWPALESLGGRADVLVLPALDDDRARAAALMTLDERVARVIVPGGWPGHSGPVERCRDLRFGWDGVEFQTFAAEPRHCVLRVSVENTALLLTGDLTADAERRLLRRVGGVALASDVVLIGRQASASASSPEWIEMSTPGLAIASGGLPDSRARREVLARWARRARHVVETRREGGIELRLTAEGARLHAAARDARFPFAWRRP